MLPSRELNDVEEWLKTYPNLQIFSRDGSPVYKKAIDQAHEINLQISDRFHIFKNLTSYALDALRRIFKKRIPVSLTEAEIEAKATASTKELSIKERRIEALAYISEGKDIEWISKKLKMKKVTVKKLSALTPEARERLLITKREETKKQNRANKLDLVSEARALKKDGLNISQIGVRMGLSRPTVRKYLDKNLYSEKTLQANVTPGTLAPYEEVIHELIEKGMTAAEIASEIRQNGCVTSQRTISRYVAKIKSSSDDDTSRHVETVEIIERKNIVQLLFYPLKESKAITPQQFKKICSEYPLFQQVYNAVWEFRAIYKQNNSDELEKWMKETSDLNIKEFNSFIKGIERDLEAIKNSIIYEFNNGLAEGFVNKIKVIKRIMFGRCSFDTLKLKVLAIEKMKNFN